MCDSKALQKAGLAFERNGSETGLTLGQEACSALALDIVATPAKKEKTDQKASELVAETSERMTPDKVSQSARPPSRLGSSTSSKRESLIKLGCARMANCGTERKSNLAHHGSVKFFAVVVFCYFAIAVLALLA